MKLTSVSTGNLVVYDSSNADPTGTHSGPLPHFGGKDRGEKNREKRFHNFSSLLNFFMRKKNIDPKFI